MTKMICTGCGNVAEKIKGRGLKCSECYKAMHRKNSGRKFLEQPFEYLREGYHIPLMTQDWRHLELKN